MAKQLLNLQNKIAQSEKEKSERDKDNNCNVNVMHISSTVLFVKSEYSSGDSKDKSGSNSNTDSATYVIDTTITQNTISKCLDTITEAMNKFYTIDYLVENKIDEFRQLNAKRFGKSI